MYSDNSINIKKLVYRWHYKIRYLLGHSPVLHPSISVGCPSQVPPLVSSTSLTRVLVLVPAPHVVEHSPKTQSSHTQWTAEIQVGCWSLIFGFWLKLNSFIAPKCDQYSLPGFVSTTPDFFT